MPTSLRKSRRFRGSRTCGWGQVGQHRKSGMKGGHGKAGLHKHKWSWTVKYAPEHFGGNPLKPSPNAAKPRWINVGHLDELRSRVEAGGKATLNLRNLGYGKLLGEGEVKRAYKVIVGSFTERAKEKIEKAGGEIVAG